MYMQHNEIKRAWRFPSHQVPKVSHEERVKSLCDMCQSGKWHVKNNVIHFL